MHDELRGGLPPISPGNGLPHRADRPAPRPSAKPPSDSSMGWMFILGVVLPALTLAIELATGMCANTFFDPIRSWWQTAAVALVPLANLAACRATAAQNPAHLRWLCLANGCALAVTLLYAILFIPLIPVGLIGMIFVGGGLLPLSPILGLTATIALRRALNRLAAPAPAAAPAFWPGFLAILLVFAAIHARTALTLHGLRLAAAPAKTKQARGLALLRKIGDRDLVLRACYGEDPNWLIGVFKGWDDNFSDRDKEAKKVREIYFRVTGVAFDSQPMPRRLIERNSDQFNDQGGTQVASKVAGLSLTGSRLDGKTDVHAGTSYVEWTLVFKNTTRWQSEARAQMELPPGAVVSRLTLWVNGEEREAAFGGRSHVREAYRAVAIRERRDPVLVTTSGPGRVLMQCFPVPANGEMKVRVGITAPLQPLDAQRSALALPRIIETNFTQAPDFTHDLWLESNAPLGEHGPVFRAQLSEANLIKLPALIVQRSPEDAETWSDDPTDAQFILRQTILARPVPVPARLAIVIDGSQAMGPELAPLAEALKTSLPARTKVFFAGEAVLTPKDGEPPAGWLAQRRAEGGCDNLPALVEAWDFASAEPGGAVVWIHAGHPLLLSSEEPLIQRTERDRQPPAFYDLAIAPSPNRVIEALGKFPHLKRLDAGGSPAQTLRTLLSSWEGRQSQWVAERSRVPRPESPGPGAKSGRHLQRLWGLEEIERLQASREPASLERALQLALNLQLVTPISGAVVLETAEQYKRTGLTPVAADSVPTVPEPGSLLLITAGALLCANRRLRRPPQPRR